VKFSRTAICLLIILISSCTAYAEQPRYLEITLLSTNDLHCRLWPFNIPGDAAKSIPEVKGVGGASRRGTIVRRVRSETRTPVMLFDCGDGTLGHTALGNAFHGEVDIAVMNALDYDAMVPGNHEFQWPSPDVLRNARDSEFPWVCANLVDGKTGEPFLTPYIIREVDGVRIAFFGLMNDLVSKQPGIYLGGTELGLKVLPGRDVAVELVPELREKADIVVLLSHLGRGADVSLAQAVPGIDIILGGHSHSTLKTPQMVKAGQPSAFYTGLVPVVQAGYHGLYIGRTKVIYHRDRSTGRYTLMSCKGELIPINDSIPDDQEILGIVEKYEAERKAREAKVASEQKPAPVPARN
jgi:2',3'-cyclic-nucleotide 2'-phosphodiesterase (5'-nucleotidase family)